MGRHCHRCSDGSTDQRQSASGFLCWQCLQFQAAQIADIFKSTNDEDESNSEIIRLFLYLYNIYQLIVCDFEMLGISSNKNQIDSMQ